MAKRVVKRNSVGFRILQKKILAVRLTIIFFSPRIAEKDKAKKNEKNNKIHLPFLRDIKTGFLSNEDLRNTEILN